MRKFLFLLFYTAYITISLGQSLDPLQVKEAEKQQIWVDSIVKSMTIDEKIGQLLMVQIYSNKDKKHEDFIAEMITKYHVGNLIFMQGTPKKQATLTNTYQALAKIPLMIGLDGEWGLDMRLKNTYRFPWNMTLGAIQNDSLLYQFGKHLGNHCKRLGIHINFAPVLDVNTNPKNPIIGNRSFGENKENVTRKAISFTKGMQSMGILANGKHFPGHGDTASDSHHTLPFLDFDTTRLDSIELFPYKKLFDAGLASVMTAHLNIPSLEPQNNLPTSLSKNVVTNLLQNKLGFSGLIITDGLNMKAAVNYATSSAINLAALQAGNNLLLIPQDIPASIEAIKKAISDKLFSEEQLNLSVRKVLKAKYWADLHNYKPIVLKNLEEDLNTVDDELLHRKLVKNSLTIIKNDTDILPIKNLENQKIAYVKLGDSEHTSFVEILQNYTKVDVVSDANLDGLLKKLKPYNLVVIGFHKSNANPWKSYQFSNKELVWLQEIARAKKIVLNVFASPYSLLKIKSFVNIESILVSYQNSTLAQELSAQLIFGALEAKGKLPVSINNFFLEGAGIYTPSLQRLAYSIPEEVNLSSRKLQLINTIADSILTENMAPGFQILVAKKGTVVFNRSYGFHTNKSKRKVKNTDLYDIASLTKIIATLPLLMKSEEMGQLSLSSQLQELLPEFTDTNKDTLTVKEILSHVAKLPGWIPFYRVTQENSSGRNLDTYYKTKKNKKYSIKVAENLFLLSSYKDSIYKQITTVELRKKDGYKYSDLGYYLFQKFLENTYEKPLNNLVSENFYTSLGMDRTSYLPLQKFSIKEIVPTEKDTYYRNQILQGYVHDMGAAMLGGVGGHAGLFANANDIAKMMQFYLQGGFYGGKTYLQPETIKKFNTRYFADKEVRRGLGFDKPQLNPKIEATCGCVSDESFGHSGFTGTYTWADPESEIIYVFLSNRVFPTMENIGLVKENIRTKIQQIIQDAIISE